MKTYVINFILTDKDYYRLTLRTLIRSKPIFRMIGILFLPFLAVTIVPLVLTGRFQGDFSDALSYLLFPAAVMLVIYGAPFFVIRFRKRGWTHYEIDAAGMKMIDGERTVHSFPWSDVMVYTELPDYLLVTVTKNSLNTQILPKSGFASEEEVRSFIGELEKRYIPKR